MTRLKVTKEKTAAAIFFVAAAFSVFSVVAIVGYILYASVPALSEIGVFRFLFGSKWLPSVDTLPASKRFGIAPMIVGSLLATVGAVALGGLAGVFVAICLVWFCPKKLKGAFKQIINLLSGIPSIVFGYFGLVQIVPMLASVAPNQNGNGLLAVWLILAMMILPTVASIAKDSLLAVPREYYEGAIALGMTKEQAVFRIMVPAARSGMVTAIGLGVGRAVGETMAVVMIAGNTAAFPGGLFEGFRTMTTNIVLDMSYATGVHQSALMATGFILLLFVLTLNVLLLFFRRDRVKERGKARRLRAAEGEARPVVFVKRRLAARLLMIVSAVFSAITVAALGYLIAFVLVKGVPHLSWDFLFGQSSNGHVTLLPAFVSTGALILIALAIALPIGVGAAIYLVEYAKSGSKVVKVIRLFTDTLAGIPSIVFGLFGVIVFNDLFGLGYSLLSGGLTLSLIVLPTIVRSTEESLLAVPISLREASYALGAGKIRTIFVVVLPCAIRGILTAIILSIGRIVGESAALIFTAGSVKGMPDDLLSPGSSFAVMMYIFASEGLYVNEAYATAVVLIVFVAALNLLVSLMSRDKKEKA